MPKYKLTNHWGMSLNSTYWEVGKTVSVEKPGNELCTDQVLHFYYHPLLAVIFNPIHSDFYNPRLFEVEGYEVASDHQIKGGAKSLTVIRELPLPNFTLMQKMAFAIYCASIISPDAWAEWANNWLLDNTLEIPAEAMPEPSAYMHPILSITHAMSRLSDDDEGLSEWRIAGAVASIILISKRQDMCDKFDLIKLAEKAAQFGG